MLAILHIGSNAAGNLFVTVRGNVNEDSFGTMNGICGICGNLSGGTDAPNLTAQLDKTKFLDGVQRVTEALVIVQCNMKTAHGHDAGNSMAGGTGTNNSDILNHNKTPPCFNSLPLMPVAPGRAVTMCGTLTDIYYKKLGITIQIGNCGGVYHRFRCNLSTKDPRYRYSVPGI